MIFRWALITLTIASAAVYAEPTTGGGWSTYGGDKGFHQIFSTRPDQSRERQESPRGLAAVGSAITKSRINFPTSPHRIISAALPSSSMECSTRRTASAWWKLSTPLPAEPNGCSSRWSRRCQEAAGQSTRGVVAYWRKQSRRASYLHPPRLPLRHRCAKPANPSATLARTAGVWLDRHAPDQAGYFGYRGPFVVNDVIVVGGNGGGKTGEGYGDDGFEWRIAARRISAATTSTLASCSGPSTCSRIRASPATKPGAKVSRVHGQHGRLGFTDRRRAARLRLRPARAPTVSYYGGHRPGKNLYSRFPTLPERARPENWFRISRWCTTIFGITIPLRRRLLGDITVAGRRIKAVIASNKTGFLYVFDRVTGKPVWPIEERPVPQSTTPGEETWPTQPFPTKPPAFDRQGFTVDDLIDFTPELHQKALEFASHYVLGPLFTPPSLMTADKKGTLAMPSAWGAGNWNTGAFDPQTGIYYAVSMTQPTAYGLKKNNRSQSHHGVLDSIRR